MKLTPYKLARIKLYLPKEDRELIDNKDWSPELTSKIHKMAHFLSPKRLSRTKGAFGHPGLDRKEEKRIKAKNQLKEIVDNEKTSRQDSE